MNNLNSVIIEGVLSDEVKIMESMSGFYNAQFTIESSRTYRSVSGDEKTETNYFDCEAYGLLAQHFSEIKECKKGAGVRVVGRLKMNKWADSDGKKWSKIIVVVEHIEFKKEA